MPQPLTTVAVKRFEIGSRSARVVIDRLNGKRPRRVHNLDFELIEGATA